MLWPTHDFDPFCRPFGELVCYGTEDGRSLGTIPIAQTAVSFSMHREEDFQECLDLLRQFSVVLRSRDSVDVKYGWGKIFADRDKKTVSFVVLWYDREFFERRQHAYRSKLHADIFRRFSLSPEDLSVTHRMLQSV